MLTSQILVQNNLSASLSIPTTVSSALSSDYWGTDATTAGPVALTTAYWVSRSSGITDGDTWVFTTPFTLAGTQVSLQVQLTGTLLDSDIAMQVTAGSQASGWSDENPVSVSFTGDDGANYVITGTFLSGGIQDNVQFSVAATILPQIKNVVVLMMENRSLDNLLGWIYDGTDPAQVLPAGSSSTFNGLSAETHSNTDAGVNGGNPVNAANGTTAWTVAGQQVSEFNVPTPDPGEGFADVAIQIAGDMGGFLTNYLTQVTAAGGPNDAAQQIMQSYSTTQVPVITGLATGHAVSDAWYSSVPSQTWPNRCFLLCGTSGGYTDNANHPITGLTTIFDVLSAQNIGWAVYSDNPVSLVKVIFPQFWDDFTHFGGISDFNAACQAGTLPPLTFLEPPFGVDVEGDNLLPDASYHPPYDVTPAETFLSGVVGTIQAAPNASEILFVLLFDEHGGTYDHMEPPTGAQPPQPDPVATDGTGYTFDQFGVRVPAILVSPYVTPGTVFRSPTQVPFDHTSVLATLRDWLGLQVAFANMLPSPRIAAAPTLASVLSSTPVASPALAPAPRPIDPRTPFPHDETPLNDLQRSIAVATAARMAGKVPVPEHYAHAGPRLRNLGDLRALLTTLNAAPPPPPPPPAAPSGPVPPLPPA